jgi:hypothetical protein
MTNQGRLVLRRNAPIRSIPDCKLAEPLGHNCYFFATVATFALLFVSFNLVLRCQQRWLEKNGCRERCQEGQSHQLAHA